MFLVSSSRNIGRWCGTSTKAVQFVSTSSFVNGKDDDTSLLSRKGTTRTIITTGIDNEILLPTSRCQRRNTHTLSCAATPRSILLHQNQEHGIIGLLFHSTFTTKTSQRLAQTSQIQTGRQRQQQLPTCCYFSSSFSVKDKEEGKVLYKRNEGRSWRPRFLSAFGVMHTAYWSWYNYDYIPALADKGIEVSKYFGLLGLGTGFFMMGLSVIYPLHLITELRELPSKAIQIKTFTLPFIVPAQEGMTWSRGSVTMVNPVDRKLVLEKGGGAISKYEGHLSLKKPDSTRFFYLLHPHPTEVMDDVALANLLLDTDITKVALKEKETKHSSPPSPTTRRRRGYASPRSNRAPSATTRRVIRKPQQKTD